MTDAIDAVIEELAGPTTRPEPVGSVSGCSTPYNPAIRATGLVRYQNPLHYHGSRFEKSDLGAEILLTSAT